MSSRDVFEEIVEPRKTIVVLCRIRTSLFVLYTSGLLEDQKEFNFNWRLSFACSIDNVLYI